MNRRSLLKFLSASPMALFLRSPQAEASTSTKTTCTICDINAHIDKVARDGSSGRTIEIPNDDRIEVTLRQYGTYRRYSDFLGAPKSTRLATEDFLEQFAELASKLHDDSQFPMDARGYFKQLGSAGVSDPLNQYATIGWKFTTRPRCILHENRTSIAARISLLTSTDISRIRATFPPMKPEPLILSPDLPALEPNVITRLS